MAVPKIDYVSSWQTRLTTRLYVQFCGAVTWQQWVALLARQFQDLEDAGQSMLSAYDYTNNAGALLDLVGGIVGQQRLGSTDANYIVYIAARIIANRGTTTAENIFSVMRAIFGANAMPRYAGGYAKQFIISITGVSVTLAQALIGVEFLNDTKDVGARAILVYDTVPASQIFTYGFATTLLIAVVAGSNSVYVSDKFLPASGTVIIDQGLSNQETWTFTYTAGTNFINLSGNLAFNHSANACVSVVGGSAGLGYDGGYFADALQAGS